MYSNFMLRQTELPKQFSSLWLRVYFLISIRFFPFDLWFYFSMQNFEKSADFMLRDFTKVYQSRIKIPTQF